MCKYPGGLIKAEEVFRGDIQTWTEKRLFNRQRASCVSFAIKAPNVELQIEVWGKGGGWFVAPEWRFFLKVNSFASV